MKRWPVVLLAVASACAPPPKLTPADDQSAQDLAIVMSVGIQETSTLKAGQWALYSVRTEGTSASAAARLAVVGEDAGTFWIENRTNIPSDTGGRQRTMISKYQIDPAANVLQLWVAEPPGRPVKVYPGKDAQGNPLQPPRPPAADPRTKVDIAQERITTAATGKSYDCTRLTSKVTYPDGRETALVTWCSKDVPFPAVYQGKSYGGVVRRTYGPHTLELDAKGTDAVPQLAIPESR